MHIGVGVGLLVRLFLPLTFGVGHGDGVVLAGSLGLDHKRAKALKILGAKLGIAALGRLIEAVEGIVHQIALRTAAFPAHQPHRFKLAQQVVRGAVDLCHAVHGAPGFFFDGQHQRRQFGIGGHVVGHADGVDARQQRRLVGDAVDASPVDEHAGLKRS